MHSIGLTPNFIEKYLNAKQPDLKEIKTNGDYWELPQVGMK